MCEGNRVLEKYKDHIASVECDDSAGILHGLVANSGACPTHTFEAADAREHLARCEGDGVEPRNPCPGKLDSAEAPESMPP
ncbi:MAG: hypothetical protein OXM56_08330 [Gammaproteobacteria bacterium]|nr:hypothetical protein [Gammaproteobacteria bacterium]